MSRSKFPPHGDYRPLVEGQVLIAHCWGSWNIEMHQESAERSKPLIEALEARGPWGVVTVVHDSMVTSLAVLEAGRQAVESLPESSRLVALAWVLDLRLEGYSILLKRYESMYAGLLETRTFDDLPAAQEWIEKVIASAAEGN